MSKLKHISNYLKIVSVNLILISISLITILYCTLNESTTDLTMFIGVAALSFVIILATSCLLSFLEYSGAADMYKGTFDLDVKVVKDYKALADLIFSKDIHSVYILGLMAPIINLDSSLFHNIRVISRESCKRVESIKNISSLMYLLTIRYDSTTLTRILPARVIVIKKATSSKPTVKTKKPSKSYEHFRAIVKQKTNHYEISQ